MSKQIHKTGAAGSMKGPSTSLMARQGKGKAQEEAMRQRNNLLTDHNSTMPLEQNNQDGGVRAPDVNEVAEDGSETQKGGSNVRSGRDLPARAVDGDI